MSGRPKDLPDFLDVLAPVADRVARVLGGTGRCVLVSRAGGVGCEVLRPRLLEPGTVEALSGASGGVLLTAARRRAGPLRVAVADLPREASPLRSVLSAAGVADLAVVPLAADAGVAAALVVAGPVLESQAEDDEGPSLTDRVTSDALHRLWVTAGGMMLDSILDIWEKERGRIPHGGIVVDRADRLLFAFGAVRGLPGWAHEDLVGQPLHLLPMGEALARLAATAGQPTSWTDHGVWTDWDEIPVAVAGGTLGSAGGSRMILLRDHRLDGEPAEGGLVLREYGEHLLEAAAEIRRDSAAACPASGLIGYDAEALRSTAERALRSASLAGAGGSLDLNRLFRRWMVARGGSLRSEGVRVLSLLAPELSPAAGDPVAVAGALRALLVDARNALRPVGGTITLRSWEDDGFLHAAVADDGSGAGGGGRNSAFEPLEPGTAPGGNTDCTGSLEKARAVLARVNGRLDLDIRPQVWTRRTVFLPVAAADPMPPETDVLDDLPAAVLAQSSGSGSLEVLVVDDNAALRNVVRRFLERRGHQVTEAVNGLEALEKIESREFDRIVIDLHMPERSGRELFEDLGRVAPGLRERAVFMSGGTTEEAMIRFLEECGCPAIQKPFDLQEMARAVEK